jgi:hypothetical protein
LIIGVMIFPLDSFILLRAGPHARRPLFVGKI